MECLLTTKLKMQKNQESTNLCKDFTDLNPVIWNRDTKVVVHN